MPSGFLDFLNAKMKHKRIPQQLQILQTSYLHTKRGKSQGSPVNQCRGWASPWEGTILIAESPKQKILWESKTTLLFHVLSEIKLSHQKPLRKIKDFQEETQKPKKFFLFQSWSEFLPFLKQQSHRLQHISPINSTSLMAQLNFYPGNNVSSPSHKDQLVLNN